MDQKKFLEESRTVRELLYHDQCSWKEYREYGFDRYILDNIENEMVLKEALTSNGIKLIVAPTGVGKSCGIVQAAAKATQEDINRLVVIVLPTRALAIQLANDHGDTVRCVVGGMPYINDKRIVTTTYEKSDEIISLAGREYKLSLVLDESQILVEQHTFRYGAISGIIRSIEQNMFSSVCLVTATPKSMTLFRCESMIEFKPANSSPGIDKIEIVRTDNVDGYLNGLDLESNFPVILYNDKDKIKQHIDMLPKDTRMETITSEDKKKPLFMGILSNSKLDASGIKGVYCTSVIGSGVSITQYPANTLPIIVFQDNNVNADNIEQFFNRFRMTDERHISRAIVLVKKSKEISARACLVKEERVIYEFTQIEIIGDVVCLNENDKLCTFPNGRYKVEIEVKGHTCFKELEICSEGMSDSYSVFSKSNPNPLMYRFNWINFMTFNGILKMNISLAKEIIEFDRKLKEFISALPESDYLNKEHMYETMAKEGINSYGGIAEAFTLKNGGVQLDKRILYMVSYNQFQRQYYYHTIKLKHELTNRMGTRVVICDNADAVGDKLKKKKKYNPKNIWEGLEDLRTSILMDDEYWSDVMGRTKIYWSRNSRHWENISMLQNEEHLLDFLKKLENNGVVGAKALKILCESQTRKEIMDIINDYTIKNFNGLLSESHIKTIDDIRDIIKSKDNKIQASIYFYVNGINNKTFTINEKLLEGIVRFYCESFGVEYVHGKLYQKNKKKIEKIIKKMYLNKTDNTMRKKLKLIKGEDQ